jgi:hypothetical protein
VTTKANLASAGKPGVTAEQLRNEIDQCRSMLKQVEELIHRHRGSILRH